MLTKKIDSLQHPLVKRWVKLRKERSYREEAQSFLISGKKIVEELRLPILISTTPSPPFQTNEHYIVSEEILKKITGLEQPDGFAAVGFLPAQSDLKGIQSLLVLDRISDPGNLGTLLRTALALGWEGVIVTENSVDLFNDKALRAAKGATFHLPFRRFSAPETARFLQENGFSTFTADLSGLPLSQIEYQTPVALILSNESHGPSSWSNSFARKVTIPMDRAVESLNVATSGAILLYHLRKNVL